MRVPTITHIPIIPIVNEACRMSGADIFFLTEDDKEVLAIIKFFFI